MGLQHGLQAGLCNIDAQPVLGYSTLLSNGRCPTGTVLNGAPPIPHFCHVQSPSLPHTHFPPTFQVPCATPTHSYCLSTTSTFLPNRSLLSTFFHAVASYTSTLTFLNASHCPGTLCNIDAQPVYGYGIFLPSTRLKLEYPSLPSSDVVTTHEVNAAATSAGAPAGLEASDATSATKAVGWSFHNGRFVQNLRKAAAGEAG